MNGLEARFRRKFVPHGEGFLYRALDRDVIFDAAEVEQLVADWRRYWPNPWFWALWLGLGVVVPALISYWQAPGWQLFILIACFVWLGCLISLAVSLSGLATAATRRESVGPGRGPQYWYDVFLLAVALANLGMVIVQPSSAVFGYWTYAIWGATVFVAVARLVQTFRWRQRRSAGLN